MPLGYKLATTRGSLAPIDLQWEEHKKILESQSFSFVFVAMFSNPLYTTCKPCP